MEVRKSFVIESYKKGFSLRWIVYGNELIEEDRIFLETFAPALYSSKDRDFQLPSGKWLCNINPLLTFDRNDDIIFAEYVAEVV